MLKKGKVDTKISKKLTDCLSSNPLKLRTFKNKIHFSCDVTVASNANRDNFAQYIFVVDEFKKKITLEHVASIILKMSKNLRHLFNFSEIIEYSDSMMFYSKSPI